MPTKQLLILLLIFFLLGSVITGGTIYLINKRKMAESDLKVHDLRIINAGQDTIIENLKKDTAFANGYIIAQEEVISHQLSQINSNHAIYVSKLDSLLLLPADYRLRVLSGFFARDHKAQR